jgi:hypothetical protein
MCHIIRSSPAAGMKERKPVAYGDRGGMFAEKPDFRGEVPSEEYTCN